MTDQARAKVVVRGVVQGVGYRYFVRKAAVELGVAGRVRNRFDGSVEVLAEGDGARVRTLIDHLRVGPRFASVESVDVEWEDPTGEFRGFDYAF